MACSSMQVWQQDAQAKAAKHCSTENRQQEAQAMAVKHWSESLRSTRSAVSTRYCCLLCQYSCSNIWCTHCNSYSCLYNMRTHNYPFWPRMTSVVMVLNLFLNLLHSWRKALLCTVCFPSLLQICILQVLRRQPRPGDSVMGRRVAFHCDVNVLMMVLHESNPVFSWSYQDTSWL